jgi:hypothetical protein
MARKYSVAGSAKLAGGKDGPEAQDEMILTPR